MMQENNICGNMGEGYRISSKRIRGRLLLEVQTSRLLFISALPQCGDYSRVATIQSTHAAATIYFNSTAMRRLFEGGYYSKYRRRGYYLFQLYRNAFEGGYYSKYRRGDYSRAATIRSTETPRLLFISALPQCGDYSRAAIYYSEYRRRGYYLFQSYPNSTTIRGRLLFEVRC